MSKGYILLHRKLKEHWLFQEKRKFSKLEAWIDILIACNHDLVKTFIKGHLFEIERGQSLRSMKTMAEDWGWNKNAVKRFLDLLQKDNMICYKNETVTTRLIVCNYDSYQDFKNGSGTAEGFKSNADGTAEGLGRDSIGNKQNTINTPNTPKAPKAENERAAKAAETKLFNSEFKEIWSYLSSLPNNKNFDSAQKQYSACRRAGFSEEDIKSYYWECYCKNASDKKYIKQFKTAVTIGNLKAWKETDVAEMVLPEEEKKDAWDNFLDKLDDLPEEYFGDENE